MVKFKKKEITIGARITKTERGLICKAANMKRDSVSSFISKAAIEKAKITIGGEENEGRN